MVNIKKTLAFLFVLVLILSCNLMKQVQNITSSNIAVSLTECGSYEVKNNQIIIGYAVKPFVVEVDRVNEITDFEQKLRIKYKDKFKKDYRIYSFTTDRVGDTILNTIFFAQKHTKGIPDWKCELQEVDTYWPKKNSLFKSKKPEWVAYNCSKKRFKVPSYPD